MKTINRQGEVLEDSGEAFEQSMDKATGKVMWVNLGVCLVLGLAGATFLYMVGTVVLNYWME